MKRLGFLDSGYKHSAVRKFWMLRDHMIPMKRGVYILLADGGETFRYPHAHASPIFYIGRADNLRHRLEQHLGYAEEAKQDRKRTMYWARYE